MTNTEPQQLSLPFIGAVTNTHLRTRAESRIDLFDMTHEDDLYDRMDQLELERSDGWIFLYKTISDPSYVNVCCSPDIDMSRSLFSRMSRAGYKGFIIIDSIFVVNRRQAFKDALERVNRHASKILKRSKTHQWFMISDVEAIAALRSAA